MPSLIKCSPFCAEMLRPRALALAITAFGAAQLGAARLGWGVPCFFHSLIGIPCPGCGLTRSVLALVRGDWRESILLHPFGPLVLLALLAALAAGIMPDSWRLRWLHVITTVEQKTGIAVWGFIVLFVVWGMRLGGVLHLKPV